MKMMRVSGVDSLGQRYWWNGIGWSDNQKDAALVASNEVARTIVGKGQRDLTTISIETLEVTTEPVTVAVEATK